MKAKETETRGADTTKPYKFMSEKEFLDKYLRLSEKKKKKIKEILEILEKAESES